MGTPVRVPEEEVDVTATAPKGLAPEGSAEDPDCWPNANGMQATPQPGDEVDGTAAAAKGLAPEDSAEEADCWPNANGTGRSLPPGDEVDGTAAATGEELSVDCPNVDCAGASPSPGEEVDGTVAAAKRLAPGCEGSEVADCPNANGMVASPPGEDVDGKTSPPSVVCATSEADTFSDDMGSGASIFSILSLVILDTVEDDEPSLSARNADEARK